MYKNIFKNDQMKRSEHMAVRETVGWYYWTHQILEVTGADATAFLDYMYPNNVSKLAIGRDRYTVMLNQDGDIIDDVVIMRMAEDKYWVSTLFASDTDDWWYLNKGDYDVDWEERTDDWSMYAVQGPKSKELLNSITKEPVDGLRFFEHNDNEIAGIPVVINRAGYTGEKLGFEVYVSADDRDTIEEKISQKASELGGKEVTDFQILAWTLPTEAGFYYMRDLAHTNPFEVGLEKNIQWDKNFIGKDALLKIKEEGPKREMVGFEVPEEDVFITAKQYGGPGEPVYIDGEEVGRVSKMVYSYVKEVNNGYILADKDRLHVGDKLKINGFDAVITEKNWL